MALFFIVSGYCYREKNISMGDWVTKKLKVLWIPNFISVLVLSLTSNILVDLHIVSTDAYVPLTVKNFIANTIKALLFGGGRQLLGANWFLRTLFFGLMLYEIINRLLSYININKWTPRTIICIALLTIGWLLTEIMEHGMYFNILSVPVLLEVGRGIKHKDMINWYRNKGYVLACGFVSLALLTGLSKLGSITMNYNVIVNPLFFLLCSLLGFSLCVSVADLIYKHSKKLRRITAYMGANSLAIMLLHFVSFKVITLLQIILLGEDIEKLTSYPVYISSNGWWIVYSVAGISIPLLAVSLWKGFKNKLRE